MDIKQLESLFIKAFPYKPTDDQGKLIKGLSEFLLSGDERSLFMLKGYAGTGKTTIVSTLTKILPLLKARYFLLAPTGRAAKVMANYSGSQAFTIHKKIYKLDPTFEGRLGFVLKFNTHRDTLFIVDEASMIHASMGKEDENKNDLLRDLMEYVYTGENCRIMLIGDDAQLPPVGSPHSPALNAEYLHQAFGFAVFSYQLKEVVRQEQDSGILENATRVRNCVEDASIPTFISEGYKDVKVITGMELEDALNSAYSRYGEENVLVICRSNKRANLFNQQIRARIKWQENELSAGDLLMVVKNNYHWLSEYKEVGFIANGDTIEVLKVLGTEELYGLRFARIVARMIDFPDLPDMEVYIILDTLQSDAPALSGADSKKLFEGVFMDFPETETRSERFRQLRTNKYYNALQVKFAYALTCHKAQGGQWECVFVEQGYLTEEMINTEYMRWLYTAVSRATKELYLVNFHERFLGGENAFQ